MATKRTTTKRVTKTKTQEVQNNLNLSVYDISGNESKQIEPPKDIFDTKINNIALSRYIRVYLANQRQGTASTKTRSEVAGTTKKIYKQKGTGKARHGAAKAPIFVGGGITGGPKPRDFSLTFPKKQLKMVFKNALTSKAHNQDIIGLTEDANTIEPKTKTVQAFLNAVKINDVPTLIVMSKLKDNKLMMASRNIANVEVMSVSALNPYALLKHKKVIFTEDALYTLLKNVFSYEH